MKLGIVVLTAMAWTSSVFAGPRCQFLSYFGNATEYVKKHPGQFPPELIPTPMLTTKEWGDAERKVGMMTLVGTKDLGGVGKIVVGYNVSTAPKEERTISISIQRQGLVQKLISTQAYPDKDGIVSTSFSDKSLNDLTVKVKCKGLELDNPLPELDYDSPEFKNSDRLFFVND